MKTSYTLAIDQLASGDAATLISLPYQGSNASDIRTYRY